MVKFASAEETGFKRVVGELIRWEAELRYETLREEHLSMREVKH